MVYYDSPMMYTVYVSRNTWCGQVSHDGKRLFTAHLKKARSLNAASAIQQHICLGIHMVHQHDSLQYLHVMCT